MEDAASVATYTVTGDLTGCWYIDEWTIHNETPSGATQASGTEQFRAVSTAPAAALLDDLHVHLQGRRRRRDARTMPPPDRRRRRWVRRREGRDPDARPAERLRRLHGAPVLRGRSARTRPLPGPVAAPHGVARHGVMSGPLRGEPLVGLGEQRLDDVVECPALGLRIATQRCLA